MNKLLISHPQLVAALVKPPRDIINSMTEFTADLWHGATGVSGEAGELLEAVLFPPVDGVDIDNLREELGDLFFYIEQITQRAEISLDWDALYDQSRNNIISPDAAITHAASISVHGSQVLDTIKKAAIYNKALDKELLTNQLSALGVSMLTLAIMFGLSRGESLDANIQKLSKRYTSLHYSDVAAQARADKQIPRTSDMSDIVSAEIGENLYD